MEQIRGGSKAAFRRLLERHWSDLVRYASGSLEYREDAEDVVQECFIRVWQRRASWRPEGSVSGFLYRIVRNLALNAKRDLKALRSRHVEFEAAAPLGTTPPDPHQVLLSERLRREVAAAIGELPTRRREVFVLARYYGLSHREIAETMGISSQTVANQMGSAMADLRVRLAPSLGP